MGSSSALLSSLTAATNRLSLASASSSSFNGSARLLVSRGAPPSLVVASPPLPPLQIRAMKKIQGKVVCASNDKTIAVEVTRIAPHKKYKKRIKTSKKYHVHDPDNTCKVGDIVTVVKCAPVSKSKSFVVAEVKTGRTPSTQLPAPALPSFEPAVSA